MRSVSPRDPISQPLFSLEGSRVLRSTRRKEAKTVQFVHGNPTTPLLIQSNGLELAMHIKVLVRLMEMREELRDPGRRLTRVVLATARLARRGHRTRALRNWKDYGVV